MLKKFCVATMLIWVTAEPGFSGDKSISKEPVKIFATAWGQSLAADGSGFYNDLAGLWLKDITEPVRYMPLPYERAKRNFLADKNSCIYPSAEAQLKHFVSHPEFQQFRISTPIINVRTHLFYQSREKPVLAKSQLKGMSIGVVRGSAMIFSLSFYGADVLVASNETDKAMMLLNGRVKVIAGMIPDTVLLFRALQADLPSYDIGVTFMEAGLSVICHHTANMQEISQNIDASISMLRLNGKLAEFLSSKGLSPAEYLPIKHY